MNSDSLTQAIKWVWIRKVPLAMLFIFYVGVPAYAIVFLTLATGSWGDAGQVSYQIPQDSRVEFNARKRFYIQHCKAGNFGLVKDNEACDKMFTWVMSAAGIGGDFPLQNAPKPLLE